MEKKSSMLRMKFMEKDNGLSKRSSSQFTDLFLEKTKRGKPEVSEKTKDDASVPVKRRKIVFEPPKTATNSGLLRNIENKKIWNTYQSALSQSKSTPSKIPLFMNEKPSPPWEDEGKTEEECLLDSLRKMVNENQELRKENEELKQLIKEMKNSFLHRLFTPDIHMTTIDYLQQLLSHLEKTAPTNIYSSFLRDDLNLQDKNTKPLIIDPRDPDKYSKVLVDQLKVSSVVKKAKQQKYYRVACLLNGLIDILFSPEELASSRQSSLKGEFPKKKEDKLEKVKILACEEFIKQTCNKEGWKEPSQREFQKIFTAKIDNARWNIRHAMQKAA
ncbi:uncharacterized protein LOC103095644 isoform X2 [Monodelphis domestica]|uniref:uncharacterized protein LOC103095644 isoform X2 n=1 Tax=Monodelphis domestica TaxID=13616 RepID=UPI000443376A|nr:uncharacterized protein LOC103095644 isoform X2 [Monodelphis domestica]